MSAHAAERELFRKASLLSAAKALSDAASPRPGDGSVPEIAAAIGERRAAAAPTPLPLAPVLTAVVFVLAPTTRLQRPP